MAACHEGVPRGKATNAPPPPPGDVVRFGPQNLGTRQGPLGLLLDVADHERDLRGQLGQGGRAINGEVRVEHAERVVGDVGGTLEGEREGPVPLANRLHRPGRPAGLSENMKFVLQFEAGWGPRGGAVAGRP